MRRSQIRWRGYLRTGRTVHRELCSTGLPGETLERVSRKEPSMALFLGQRGNGFSERRRPWFSIPSVDVHLCRYANLKNSSSIFSESKKSFDDIVNLLYVRIEELMGFGDLSTSCSFSGKKKSLRIRRPKEPTRPTRQVAPTEDHLLHRVRRIVGDTMQYRGNYAGK